MAGVSIGAMFRRDRPPDELIPFARFCEAVGLDEMWVVEDCFWSGGLTAASAALAVTATIRVGMGIVPAVARNAAIVAMEMAGVSRMFPGRFVAGFGHGVAEWMDQIGALPPSQLAALTETLGAVSRLLRGERITTVGRHVCLHDVALVFPPAVCPAVLAGVTGPRSIGAIAGVADGLLLPEGSSAAYVRAARALLPPGSACAVYVLFAVDDDPDVARAAVHGAVTQFAPGGVDRRLGLLGGSGDEHGADRISRYAVAGSPAQCIASIGELVEAGATSVVLVPQLPDHEAQLTRAMREIVPALSD